MKVRHCAAASRPLAFTLLEVLVALAVTAIALGAAVRALGQSADVAGALDSRVLARWVAEDHMAGLRAMALLPAAGTRQGQVTLGGQAYAWTETTEDLPQSPLRRVALDVAPDQEGATVQAHLVIFLLRPPGT